MQAALRVIPSSFTVAIRWDVAKAFNFGGTRRREAEDSHGLRCAAPSSHTIIHSEEVGEEIHYAVTLYARTQTAAWTYMAKL